MKYWNGESFVTVHCLEQNGLPYISWEDFKPIRKLLAKEWKKRGSKYHASRNFTSSCDGL